MFVIHVVHSNLYISKNLVQNEFIQLSCLKKIFRCAQRASRVNQDSGNFDTEYCRFPVLLVDKWHEYKPDILSYQKIFRYKFCQIYTFYLMEYFSS